MHHERNPQLSPARHFTAAHQCDGAALLVSPDVVMVHPPERIMARYNRDTLEEVFLDVARGRVREGAPEDAP